MPETSLSVADELITNLTTNIVRDNRVISVPPYISYNTFKTMLEWLKSEGVPLRFDRSFWQAKFSGSNGTQLAATLRFFELLSNNTPRPELERLVNATPADQRMMLRKLITDSYRLVPFEELPRATPAMVRAWFKSYPIDGHTLRKAISFFVNAAKDTEIQISNAAKKMAKTKSSTSGRDATHRHNNPASIPTALPHVSQQSPLEGRVFGASPNRRTITLESGGSITLAIDVDLFSISHQDREFILSLVNLTRTYENRSEDYQGVRNLSSEKEDTN